MTQTTPFTFSNIPIIVIDTDNRIIPDAYKISAHMGIIDHGLGQINQITDPFNDYDGHIGIEIRGSSSTMFPKKQYAVETRDDQGANLNVAILGLPPENDWILYAPYSDKSLIRNILAYTLWEEMGHYASRSRLCELVLNGEYQGVYVLMEKIKRDKWRVDIAKLEPHEIIGDSLTGGYIIKVDKWAGEQIDGWTSDIPPYPGAWQSIYYQYHYPKPNSIVSEQKTYIQDYITAFENLMNGPDYSDPVQGYPSVVAVSSFVDYFIANELAKNVDGYRLSAFMYKDQDSQGGKLTMGPIWDFNLCYGNADYYQGAPSDGWQLVYLTEAEDFLGGDQFQVPFWWRRLFEDPAFMQLVTDRWRELRSDVLHSPRLLATIDSLVAHLDEAPARNFDRWPVLDEWVWPNAYVGGTYIAEIDTLKNWIVARIGWIDQQLLGAPFDLVDAGGLATPSHFRLLQNYPNPFNPVSTIRYELPRRSEVVLTIYDILGREIVNLVTEEQGPGFRSVTWNGRNDRGQPVSTGVYLYRIQANGFVETRKMLLLK